VTRGEGRSIEQALISKNPGFENKINSISSNHLYYQDAVDWGNAWLGENGYCCATSSACEFTDAETLKGEAEKRRHLRYAAS
jgi:hypothetical protein